MKALYTFLIGCFCVGITLAQSDIASVEYFFDVDPGIGNGTIIDINPDVDILNQNFNISTVGLSQGTHRLFMRVVNTDGTTSMHTNKTFRVSDTPATNNADIVEAEYFFNTDPGFGNATNIDVADVANLNENFLISTASLPIGTHRLFLRVKNSNNRWSMYTNKTFRVSDTPATNNADIVEAEYFFNTDPGFGNATNIDVADVANLNENFLISTASLPVGTHRLFLRVKNANNRWSMHTNKTFRVSDTPATNNADIVEAEYFFNTDPGFGNATNIDVADVANLNENFLISTASLPIGTHRLFLRVKNSNNRWSMYTNKTFRVSDTPATNNADIVEAEYFFNTDPGFGNATNIDVADVANLNENFLISTTSLPIGTHRLFLRVKNANNRWSMHTNKTFRVSDIPSTNSATITAAEFFIDADPGFGNGTTIVLNGDNLNENLVIPTSGALSQGDHYLHIRVLNADGKWSLYGRKLFQIDGTLGIDDEELSSIKIYPNPTSSIVNIKLSNGNLITKAVLFDINGKQVFTIINHLEQIDLSNFQNGIYLLQLETEKGSISKKIIKN